MIPFLWIATTIGFVAVLAVFTAAAWEATRGIQLTLAIGALTAAAGLVLFAELLVYLLAIGIEVRLRRRRSTHDHR